MWDVLACRSCLVITGNLEKLGDAQKRMFHAVTGIQYADGDGYPSYFCGECRLHIKKALAFRRRCRRAQFVLKEIMNIKQQITVADINDVDRKRTNLESSYKYCVPESNTFLQATEGSDVMVLYDAKSTNKEIPVHKVVDIQPFTIDKREIKIEGMELDEDLQIDNDYEVVNYTNNNTDNIDDCDKEIEIRNIDLEDVFKDLKEETEESDDGITEIQPFEPIGVSNDNKKQKKKEKPAAKNPLLEFVSKSHAYVLSKAIASCSVKVLTFEEQLTAFEWRKSVEEFRKAIFKCGMCLLMFKNLPDLVQHVEDHKKTVGPAFCPVCKCRYMDALQLTKHVSEYHQYEFKCNNCNQLIYDVYSLMEHYGKCNGEPTPAKNKNKTYKDLKEAFKWVALPQEDYKKTLLVHTGPNKGFDCVQCNQGFKNQKELETHLNSHFIKSSRHTYMCDVCGVFGTRRGLQAHVLQQHYYKYLCRRCAAVCWNRNQALEHKMEHRETKEFRLRCKLCEYRAKSTFKLQAHMKQAHPNAEIPIVPKCHCNVCGLSFKKPTTLYQHQIIEHGYISVCDPLIGDSDYLCSTCGVQFLDEKAYKNHMVKESHEEAKDFENACLQCRRIFDTPEEYKEHTMSCRYTKNYPKKCCYCEEMMLNFKAYRQHQQTKHKNMTMFMNSEQSVLCELCGKSVWAPSLAAHAAAHAAARAPFSCPQCPLASHNATHVAVHILYTHTHKPYICAVCQLRFVHRVECTDHILKIHAPEKPFQCEICKRWFSHFDYMKHHAKSEHGIILKYSKKARKAKKIFVYPHMQIDASNLPKELLKNIDIELADYKDSKFEPVKDYRNYLILDPLPDPTEEFRSRRSNKGDKNGVKRIKRSKTVDANDYESKKKQRPKFQYFNSNRHIIIKREEDNPKIEEDFDSKDFNKDIEMHSLEDMGRQIEAELAAEDEYNIDDMKLEMAQEEVPQDQDMLVDDDSQLLEVIEEDGNQYVMIDGVLYRLETDEG